MTYQHLKLDELIEPSGKERAGLAELPILSITVSQGLVEQSTRFRQRMASSNTAAYRVVREGELVVGFPIDEGVLSFQTKHETAIVSPAYTVWRLKDRPNVHIPYLERFLKSRDARARYAAKIRVGVARRRSLTATDFLSLEVPFPPLTVQRRIAEILNEADRALFLTETNLHKLDALSASAFVKFFGDPESNPRKWDITPLRDLGEIQTGLTPQKNIPATGLDGQKIEWITSRNIREDSIFASPSSEYIAQDASSRLRVAEPGSILMTCIAGTERPIGRVSIANRRVAFNQQINSFTSGTHVSSLFMYFLLRISRERLRQIATKGMHNLLSKGVLGAMQFITPPLEAQATFAPVANELIDLCERFQRQQSACQEFILSLERVAFSASLKIKDLGSLPYDHQRDDKNIHDFQPPNGTSSLASERSSPSDQVNGSVAPSARNVMEDSLLLRCARARTKQGKIASPFTFSEIWDEIVAIDPSVSYEEVRSHVVEAVEGGALKQIFDKDVGSIAFVLG